MLLVSSAIVGEPEKSALSAIIDSGWLTMGEQVRAFEEAFATIHDAHDCGLPEGVVADGCLKRNETYHANQMSAVAQQANQ